MAKGNKDVKKSARVSALIAARMTDRLVAFHREAGDNDYTAMDALPELLANAGQKSQEHEAAQLRQAMKRSSAETLVDFRNEIQKGEVSPAGKAKTFYRFVGSHGTIIDVAYDDMKHAGKHNLTDEQIQAIEENSENFLAVYQETKRKGNYGGIPILAKIKTPIGEAGVVYEFLPNGRVFLKTMFFDKPAAIDNWMKKSGSSKSLLDESKSSSTGNRFSIQSIQKELGIVNAGSTSYYLSQEEVRTQKEAVRKQYEGTAMWLKAPNGKDTNLTEEQWLLVRTPAFKAWFGDWEAEYRKQKNIERGTRAVDEVLHTRQDVPKAMFRSETGGIDFVYGKEGDPSKKYAGGYGIAHILAKHGQAAVDMIPTVIAKGKAAQKHNDRIRFNYAGYTAVVRLDFDGNQKTWLVTNFEKYANKKDSLTAEVFARSADDPDGAHSTVGGTLSLSFTIPQEEANSQAVSKVVDENGCRITIHVLQK